MSHSLLTVQNEFRLPHDVQPSQRPPVGVAMRQTSMAGQPLSLPGVVQGAPPEAGRSRFGSSEPPELPELPYDEPEEPDDDEPDDDALDEVPEEPDDEAPDEPDDDALDEVP